MPADHQMSQANLDNPEEIIISRIFAAPRELVWQGWTGTMQQLAEFLSD